MLVLLHHNQVPRWSNGFNGFHITLNIFNEFYAFNRIMLNTDSRQQQQQKQHGNAMQCNAMQCNAMTSWDSF